MKSKEKVRPKSLTDPNKQKSMEYVQEITVCDDAEISHLNEAIRDEYNGFVIDRKLLKSERTCSVEHEKRKIPVKVLKGVPSSNEEKTKQKDKVVVARSVTAQQKPFCQLVEKELEGNVKPHTIIGSVQEYKIAHSMKTECNSELDGLVDEEEKITLSHTQKQLKRSPSEAKNDTVYINEFNALDNWSKQMKERRKQQTFLSQQMNIASEQLLMNQSDTYRLIQEERTLIDRSMPSKDYGKGYRVGSEFWKQTECLPRDDCVNITLSETEKGNAPPLQHVGYPAMIAEEMGMDWKITHRMKYIHYPWWKSQYLDERQQHLQNVMNELNPHKPDLSSLQVVGHALQPNDTIPLPPVSDRPSEVDASCPSLLKIEDDALSEYENVIQPPIFGPCLLVNGFLAKWQECCTEDSVGVNVRLLFTAQIASTGQKNIEINNQGTTAIHYTWKQLPRYNPFNLNKGRSLNRFFFDISDGVVLPGDVITIPFVFKSPNAGIFTETWQLETLPVLCSNEKIVIALHGVATQCDEFEAERKKIDDELDRSQNRVMCERILMSVLATIKTPQRSNTPVDSYLAEDEMFRENNANLHYKTGAIGKLKQFYQEFKPEEDWDMDLKTLAEHVDCIEEEESKELAYQRINDDIKELNIPNLEMAPTSNYDACYLVLCNTFDKLAARARKLNATFGLPEKEILIKSSELSTKKSKANNVDAPNKSKTDAKMNKKDSSKKTVKQEKGKRDPVNIVNKHSELESESASEIINRSVNNNYMDKFYVEVYNCLGDMAVNLESVLSS